MLAVAVVVVLVGAAVQLLGLRSGAYGEGRAPRERLPYAAVSIACFLVGAGLVLADLAG